MGTLDITLPLAEITTDHVSSVYSGKSSCCNCGCSGIHRYHPDYRTQAGTRRGYEVLDSEVNLVHVRKVLAIVLSHGAKALVGMPRSSLLQIDVGDRRYTVFLRDNTYARVE